jgi:hypothetical protein
MRSLRAGEGIQVMAESGGSLSLDALRRRVDETLDACTRCGKCVAACPMVEPAGIDLGNDAVNAPAIVGGILDLLAGGEGTPDAARWAQVCTNSASAFRPVTLWGQPALHGQHGAGRSEGKAWRRRSPARRPPTISTRSEAKETIISA